MNSRSLTLRLWRLWKICSSGPKFRAFRASTSAAATYVECIIAYRNYNESVNGGSKSKYPLSMYTYSMIFSSQEVFIVFVDPLNQTKELIPQNCALSRQPSCRTQKSDSGVASAIGTPYNRRKSLSQARGSQENPLDSAFSDLQINFPTPRFRR